MPDRPVEPCPEAEVGSAASSLDPRTGRPCSHCERYTCLAADVFSEDLERLCPAAMLRRLQKAEDALRFPPEALLEKWMENELYDLEMLVDHLTRTYSHFSDGRISKPNTLPEEVFRVADDLETERWNVWLGDELQSVQIDRDVASSRLERVDAYWGERCEGAAPGGDSDHGPVEYTDVEGVPLCAECWAKLVAEVQVETEPEPPEAATADGERVSTEQADSSLAWLCDHLTATPDGIEVALHHQRLRAFIAQEAGR